MPKKTKWKTTSKFMLCCLCCLITFSACGTIIFSMFKLPHQIKEELGLNFRSRYPNTLVQQDFDLTPQEFAKMDQEWSEAMKYNKIQVIIFFHKPTNLVK